MPETCTDARHEMDHLLLKNGANSFYPLDRLRDHFTPEKVKQILTCSCKTCREDVRLFGNQTDPETYVKEIVGEGFDPYDSRKTLFSVFGLLISVEHPLFIIGFADRDCSDFKLESWATDATLFSRETLQRYTGSYKTDARKFEWFATKFEDSIRRFAVPHMDSGKFVHYDASVILPFVKEREIGKRKEEDGHWTSEGANGKVFAFKIHPEYCKFRDTNAYTEFARKKIETSDASAYLERSNIVHVQRFNDDHIVKLIKAYGHGESIHLIFPKAWTNLDHLLRDPAFRYGEKRGAKLELSDAWKQLLGIANALKKFQGFGNEADSRGVTNVPERLCIHFDLKPDNILVENEHGNWVITDFGQAALTQRRRGATPRVPGHFGTDAYAPPEIEDQDAESGRAYDIWSLGCIMLEVTAFLVHGYAGLKSSHDLNGLDQARRAMPAWSKHTDERFFCQYSPDGEYVVKKEIQDFMEDLENRHAGSRHNSEESKAFLKKILDLIRRMLKPKVVDRVDISRVVQTLSSALRRASAGTSEPNVHQVVVAEGETVLGGSQLNQIEVWHWSATIKEWESSFLEALENEAGFIRLHCWSRGHEPTNISFRRSDVKILPLYGFWDPNNTYDSRTWIEFSFLSPDRHSEVSNALFSFDGNAGLGDARVLQSKLTSQNIVGSFSLTCLRLNKSMTLGGVVKGFMRKLSHNEREATRGNGGKSMEFGSATVQIWTEEEDGVARELTRRQSIASRTTSTTRAVRRYQGDQQKIPPCRVAIYLHQHRFICTIKIDINWVLEESPSDNRMLFFKPHPSGQNRLFYASWIRPTQEELNAGYPAGVPLSPKVLQYYEDLDWIETEQFELTFRSTDDRKSFIQKYRETKKRWMDTREELGNMIPINRRPEGSPQIPDGVGSPPIYRRRAQFTTTLGTHTEAAFVSDMNRIRSRHDSTIGDSGTVGIDSTRLMVPDGRPPFQRVQSKSRTELGWNKDLAGG